MKGIARLFSVFLLLSLLLTGQGVRPAYAASYVVNTTDDNTTNDAFCTLREAILAANNTPANANCGAGSSADDTITFSVSGTITLGSTLPNIVSTATAGTLTIDGAGQSIVISGNNSVRVMYVPAGANLTLQNLTIANGNVGLGDGGGIYILFGTLSVTNATFSNNSATNDGGGIFTYWGTLTVTNSTFSGNSATKYGGGIFNSNSTVTVTNSTFSGNSASWGGAISTQNVGAAPFTTTTIRNTILANSLFGGDCWNDTAGGAILNGGNNLIETNSGCSGIATITSDPNLTTLTGSPAYFPLNAGSPAIDAGDNATCAAAPVNNQSQNGVIRPKDGDGNGSAICDIGAFEKESLRVFLPLVVR